MKIYIWVVEKFTNFSLKRGNPESLMLSKVCRLKQGYRVSAKLLLLIKMCSEPSTGIKFSADNMLSLHANIVSVFLRVLLLAVDATLFRNSW